MKFTVLGGAGFIGSHVAALARQLGYEVDCPARDAQLKGRDLGHVIYAIGLTADFRRRPHETIAAHVTKLQEVLTTTEFSSLVYLSSTRVYARCPVDELATETAAIPVLSSDPSDLYNLSKLMGESIALTHGPRVRIARLSNVIGGDLSSENFLTSLTRDCVLHGRLILQTALESAKDYIAVEDVANVLVRIAVEGQQPIYNVAAGTNTTHREIVETLQALTGAVVEVMDGAPSIRFPRIDVRRLQAEFPLTYRATPSMIQALVGAFRESLPTAIGP